MKTYKILTSLFFLLYLPLSFYAQNNCEETFYSLQQTEVLLPFSTANGPASFKRQVEDSRLWEDLQGCDSTYQKIAWRNVIVGSNPDASNPDGTETQGENRFNLFRFLKNIFKSKKKPIVSYSTEMKTAFLVVTYGYQNPVDVEKVKEFVRSEPWERGLNFSSHLAVDILFKYYGDSKRDKNYHTYTLSEMERARDMYAND